MKLLTVVATFDANSFMILKIDRREIFFVLITKKTIVKTRNKMTNASNFKSLKIWIKIIVYVKRMKQREFRRNEKSFFSIHLSTLINENQIEKQFENIELKRFNKICNKCLLNQAYWKCRFIRNQKKTKRRVCNEILRFIDLIEIVKIVDMINSILRSHREIKCENDRKKSKKKNIHTK